MIRVNEQQRLFDPKTTRERKPGEESFGEWESHPNTQFHGTFRSDWHMAPTAHYGPVGVAAGVLRDKGEQLAASSVSRAQYHDPSITEDGVQDYYGDEGDEPEPPLVGRVFARRLNPAQFRSTDATANAGDFMHQIREGYESWETPRSIRNSFDDSDLLRESDDSFRSRSAQHYAEGLHLRDLDVGVGRVVGALERGEAVPYPNTQEKDYTDDSWNSTPDSWVAPSSGASTWEETVNRNPHASSTAKAFATQRQAQGLAGAVGIPSLIRHVGTQPSLFPDDYRSFPSKNLTTRGGATRLSSRQFEVVPD